MFNKTRRPPEREPLSVRRVYMLQLVMKTGGTSLRYGRAAAVIIMRIFP